jgi:hypothetical protein
MPALERAGPVAHVTTVALLLALALSACSSGATPEETAPAPTLLPELRTPTVSLAASATPEPALRATPDAESAYHQLRAAIPDQLLSSCVRGAVSGAEMARVDCDPPGPDAVSYLLFDDEGAMTDAYRERLAALPAGATDGPGCGRGPGIQRLPNGRKACYREPDGTATVLWMNDLAYVLATGSRSDGDWAGLEDLWASAGPITP